MGKRLKPILGQLFGCYEVISEDIFKIKDKNREHYRGYFKVKCTKCNTEHLVRSDLLLRGQSTKCKACSNKEKYLQNVIDKKVAFKGYSIKHQGVGKIPKSLLYHYIQGAKKRNLDFEIDIEYLWSVYQKQNGKCNLSGLDISLFENNEVIMKNGNIDFSKFTASLDRIDSNLGYVEGNVQWVHKDVNLMKNSFSQDYFLKMCELITNKNKINE